LTSHFEEVFQLQEKIECKKTAKVFDVTVIKLDTLGSITFEFGRYSTLGFKAFTNTFGGFQSTYEYFLYDAPVCLSAGSLVGIVTQ
jgi:hypothetical protein